MKLSLLNKEIYILSSLRRKEYPIIVKHSRVDKKDFIFQGQISCVSELEVLADKNFNPEEMVDFFQDRIVIVGYNELPDHVILEKFEYSSNLTVFHVVMEIIFDNSNENIL